MKSIDMRDFVQEKSKENKRYSDIQKRFDEICAMRLNEPSKNEEFDEIDREWYSLIGEVEKIEDKYEKDYSDGVFYTLSDCNRDIFKIGYYDSQYYIIYSGDGEMNYGDPMILFDTKKELLEYLNLDILNNLLK
jgi:hypothetical protein